MVCSRNTFPYDTLITYFISPSLCAWEILLVCIVLEARKYICETNKRIFCLV